MPTKSLLDVTVDGELTGSKTTNHEQTSRQTSERTTDTKLSTNLDETAEHTLTRETLGLVDLGQHSISGLGDNGSSETSKETRAEIDTGLGTVGQRGLAAEAVVDGLGELLESNELGHGVGDPISSDFFLSHRS
jgi:hypothetical protein